MDHDLRVEIVGVNIITTSYYSSTKTIYTCYTFFRVCGVGGIIRDGTNDRKVRNNRVTTIINIVDDNVDVVDVDIDGIVLNDTMLGK